MHYMTFQEELPEESKQVPTKLSVYVNAAEKVVFIMETETGDPCDHQIMELGSNDTELLIRELQRLLEEFIVKP